MTSRETRILCPLKRGETLIIGGLDYFPKKLPEYKQSIGEVVAILEKGILINTPIEQEIERILLIRVEEQQNATPNNEDTDHGHNHMTE